MCICACKHKQNQLQCDKKTVGKDNWNFIKKYWVGQVRFHALFAKNGTYYRLDIHSFDIYRTHYVNILCLLHLLFLFVTVLQLPGGLATLPAPLSLYTSDFCILLNPYAYFLCPPPFMWICGAYNWVPRWEWKEQRVAQGPNRSSR